MKQDHTIEKNVDQTMQSLDGLQRAEAPAFLYTRIEAALEEDYEPAGALQWFTRPSFAVFGLLLVLLMNGMVLLHHFRQTTTGVSTDEQLLSQEYGMNTVTVENVYLVNEEQP